MQSIPEWLQHLGLEQYAQVFDENAIDVEVLPDLTDAELKDLDIPLGHRKKILKAITHLNGSDVPQPSETAQRIAPDPVERRQLTVMFCDLVGSTQLSQKLDPEELRKLIRQYQDACAGAVARFDGHIAQFLGDGVLVYFGYPIAHEGEAERAIRAGLSVIQRVAELSGENSLEVRIGIDTGLVVIGQGEALDEKERTAIGDAPNVAARLQGLAKPGTIVISERTRLVGGRAFEYFDLGTKALKGIDEPMSTWQVAGERQVETRYDAATGGFTAPMVGREMELGIAMKAWERAKAGKLQTLLLCGEPGIGKSRILRAIRELVAADGAEVWQYQCSTFFTNTALYPITSNIEHALAFERAESPESKLAKLQAFLEGRFKRPSVDTNLIGRLFALPVEDTYGELNMSPQKQKDETLRALADIAETAASRQPMLALFEDVHWADPTTIEMLDQLLSRAGMKAFVVITYRPEFNPSWIGQPQITQTTLNRLDAEQTKQVANRVAGNKKLPKEIVEQIVQKTDGVPLFVEELTKAILETDIVTLQDGNYVLRRPLTTLKIPATLHDSLMARLDRLAPTKEAAQIGACIGREFSHELLSLVSAQTKAQLGEAIEQLLASELVFQRGVGKEAVYTFKHALVQDAAYESLLKSNRTKIHATIAAKLDERFPHILDTEPELVAHHYTEAGLIEPAAPLWLRAGTLALQRMALVEAISHFNRGLNLTKLLPESNAREMKELVIRTQLGTAWVALGGWAASEAGSNFESALKLAKVLNHQPSFLPILMGLWMYVVVRGRIAESVTWATELLDAANTFNDNDLALVGHSLTSGSHFWLGNFAKGRVHAEQIPPLYDLEEQRYIADVINHDPMTTQGVYGAANLWMLGYPDQARELTNSKDEHARRRGHPFDIGFSLTIGSFTHELRGDIPEFRHRLEAAVSIGKEHNLPFFGEVLGPLMLGIAATRERRYREAQALFDDGLESWERFDAAILVPYLKCVCAQSHAAMDGMTSAFRLLDEALDQIDRPGWGERSHIAEIFRVQGVLHEQIGNRKDAEASLQTSLDWARKQAAKSWELRTSTSLARLWNNQGKRKEALDLLKPVYDWFAEGFDTKDLKEAKALLDDLES